MLTVHQLTYNPFAENTYLLVNEDQKGMLIDPGMFNAAERSHFFEYLQKQKIELEEVVLTHSHLDHVFGLNWINEQFGLTPRLHPKDQVIYKNAESTARMYGLSIDPLPDCDYDLVEGQSLVFYQNNLDILHTPGHSPGSVCLISQEHRFVIGGDVLFKGSIGRTDLPGGDHETLIDSINKHLLSLTDDYRVYSGHGPATTIGAERVSNPFSRIEENLLKYYDCSEKA